VRKKGNFTTSNERENPGREKKKSFEEVQNKGGRPQREKKKSLYQERIEGVFAGGGGRDRHILQKKRSAFGGKKGAEGGSRYLGRKGGKVCFFLHNLLGFKKREPR